MKCLRCGQDLEANRVSDTVTRMECPDEDCAGNPNTLWHDIKKSIIQKLKSFWPDGCEIESCHRGKHIHPYTEKVYPLCEKHYKLRLAIIGPYKKGDEEHNETRIRSIAKQFGEDAFDRFPEDEQPLEDLIDYLDKKGDLL